MWNTVGSVFYMATQWLITILVVRLGGVEPAGNLSLAMSVNNIFYSIAMFGIRNYQVTDVNEKYRNGTYLFSRILSCTGAMALCLTYCMGVDYDNGQKISIILYGIFKMSEALYDAYAGICQKNWRMDFIGKSWLIRGIITFVAFCGILYASGSLQTAILGMAMSSFGVIAFYDIPSTRKIADIQLNPNWKDSAALMRECFPLLCYQLLSTAVATVPRIFLERILGNYALGIYGSVAAPTLIVQMGASYIFNPFMTLFAEHYALKRKREFCLTLKKCLAGIAALSVVALAGGKLLGRWGLTFLYGEEVASYEYLLLPLIFCTILNALVWLLCGLLTTVREFKGLIWSNVLAVLVSSAGSVLLMMSGWGMQGATVGLAVGLLAECLCLALLLAKNMKNHFAKEENTV